MSLSFKVTTIINASPKTLYDAWLNSDDHTNMTGGKAIVSKEEGGEFNCWDGYISGKNITLIPNRNIIQSWRTTEFEENEPDSMIDVIFKEVEGGTEISIHHTELPPHGTQYEEGWQESYFTPMNAYFEG